jgi:hypothetical protein
MSYEIEEAARALADYISTNVGTTEDWPCEISFDNDGEADKFLRIFSRLREALED